MNEKKMTPLRDSSEIPVGMSEKQAREFWDTHEITEEYLAKADPPPEDALPPLRDYSGNLSLRMPKSLHRDLSRRAKKEGVSINQYITTVLARDMGVKEKI